MNNEFLYSNLTFIAKDDVEPSQDKGKAKVGNE